MIEVTTGEMLVEWAGSDYHSGVVSYDLYIDGTYYRTYAKDVLNTTLFGLTSSTTFEIVIRDYANNEASFTEYQPTTIKIGIEVDKYSNYENLMDFIAMLDYWGFEVVELNDTAGKYNLTGIDTLILPTLVSDLSAASSSAIVAWWNLGGKNLWFV